MTPLSEMFASTSPIAIEQAREAAIPRERAALERQLDETIAARQSLEADAIAAAKLQIAGSPDAPPDDDERDREIHRLTRREAAIVEMLTEKDAELAEVRQRIFMLQRPRDAAVAEFVGDFAETAMGEVRQAIEQARAGLVKLLAAGDVEKALRSRDSSLFSRVPSVEDRVHLWNQLEIVGRNAGAKGFTSEEISCDARLLSTEIVNSIKEGTSK